MKKTLIAVLMALLPFSVSAQGNKEINELDAATSANATDKLAADQSGTLKYLTLTQIGALLDDLIAADSITEAMMDAANPPTDEYCFTYEADTANFAWQACSSSAGDITLVGDCTTGDCFDGNGSGAQIIFETAGSGTISLSGESASSAYNLTLPANSGEIISNNTTAAGDVTGNYGALAVGDLTIASEAQGDILYFNGTNWVRLAPGTDGYYLETNGAAANPAWSAVAAGSGDITLVGDCTTGDCFDGNGSGAQLIFETAGSDVITLSGESASSTQNLTLPAESGVLLSINTTAAGDVTGNYGALALAADTVAAAEMADADHGDVSWTSGVASVEAMNADIVTEAEVADDAIEESHLKAVNAATDEYVLTYESTTGDFEWQADAGGGDSISVDGGAVVDPDFVSTGDIDFVDTSNDITGNLNADVVAAAEMADADHGDVSWTSGVASVEGVNADSVALTTDTTGNYVASVTDGDGIVGADGGSEGAALTLAVDVIDDGDAQTATTSSESGLEFVSTEMGLIRGCDNGEVLKWDETQGDWDCSADSTGGSPTFDAIASGTNTTADMVVGNGAEIELAEGGEVEANEVIIFAQNETGATIYKCSAVHIHEFDIPSALPEVIVADSDDATKMPAIGIMYETVTTGNAGRVMLGGILLTADTATAESWTEGDRLYVNDSGTSGSADCAATLTKTRPANTDDAIQAVGMVAYANAAVGKLVVSGAGRRNDVPNLQDAYFWLGNATNVATAVTMSGDVTMTNAGVTALGNDVVAPAEMADADHGDVDWSSGNATVQSMNADIVTSTEMGDDDHGDVAWSGGTATVQAGTATIITDGLIVEADLNEDSGTPTDADVLTYDSTGANFNWIAQSGVAAGTAAALAANGGDCSAGSYPLGVDAAGAVESCTDASTEIDSILATHTSVTDAHIDHADSLAELNSQISSGLVTGAHTSDTNANTICTGTGNYLDGEGNCDALVTDTGAPQTEETIEDFVGGMVTGNTETNIAVTYEDGDGTLDFVVTQFSPNADPATDHANLVSSLQENGANELTGETLGTACTENQILKANATGGLDCAADATAGGVAEDSIGTTEIDDGADTPASGEYVRVDTVDQAGFEYRTDAEVLADIGAAATGANSDITSLSGLTTDLTVAQGGTGAGTFTDGGILLGSGTGAITALGVATNGQIPIGDGTTDPQLGTITAVANETDVTNAAGSITIGIVTAPTLDAGNITGIPAGAYDADSIDSDDVAASLMTKDHCITVADPATDDEWYTVWRAPTAITITEIYCEMTGGTSVALDLEIDDGTPAAVNGSAITCDASELDSTLAGDTGMADGDRLDLDLGTVTGSVTQLSVCFEYTID